MELTEQQKDQLSSIVSEKIVSGLSVGTLFNIANNLYLSKFKNYTSERLQAEIIEAYGQEQFNIFIELLNPSDEELRPIEELKPPLIEPEITPLEDLNKL